MNTWCCEFKYTMGLPEFTNVWFSLTTASVVSATVSSPRSRVDFSYSLKLFLVARVGMLRLECYRRVRVRFMVWDWFILWKLCAKWKRINPTHWQTDSWGSDSLVKRPQSSWSPADWIVWSGKHSVRTWLS
jgi:hypothetical protein